MINNYFSTLSSNILFQSNINIIQANQINTISSYIVTNNNKLSYHDLFLYSLSGSLKYQSNAPILDSQLSSNVCLLNSSNTFNNNNFISSSYALCFQHYGQTNLFENASNFYIWNLANSGVTILRNRNSAGADVDSFQLSTTNLTLSTPLVCNNGLSLNDGTSITNLTQNLGDFSITNNKINSTGYGDIIFKTTDISNYTAERIRVSYNTLKTNVNITLPSTFTSQISGQLGYIYKGSVISVATTNLVNGTVYGIAVISLPVGVWHVFGQACYSFASTATLLYEQISINQDTQNTIIDTNNMIMTTNVSSNSGYNSIKRIDAIIQAPNTNTLLSLTISVGISSGTPVFISNTSQQYVRIYAVRIA